MSIELIYPPYKLTCSLNHIHQLTILLEPIQLTSQPDLIYEINFQLSDYPSLTLIFSNNQKVLNYISYSRQKTFNLNIQQILTQKNKFIRLENKIPNQREVGQSPIGFNIFFMGQISSTIPLIGQKKMLSKQTKLQEIILDRDRTITNLKLTLEKKQTQILSYKTENQAMSKKLKQYEEQIDRLKQQNMPMRKRVHKQSMDNDIEQNNLSYQKKYKNEQNISKIVNVSNHQEILVNGNLKKYEQLSNYVQTSPLASQNHQNNKNLSISNSQQSNEKDHQPSQKSFVTFHPQSQRVPVRSSHLQAELNEKILSLQNNIKNSNKSNQNAQVNQQLKFQNDSNGFNMNNDLQFSEPTELQPIRPPQLKQEMQIANKEKLLQSQSAKLISNFVLKCLVDVGFNERGQGKSGFVCVACEKIFKQSEFLNKHIHARHLELLESHITEGFLMGKLNHYKANREATLQATLRNKKLEKALRNYPENK